MKTEAVVGNDVMVWTFAVGYVAQVPWLWVVRITPAELGMTCKVVLAADAEKDAKLFT